MAKRGLIILVAVWGVLLLAPMFRLQTSRSLQTPNGGDLTYMTPDVNPADWASFREARPNDARLAFQDLRPNYVPNTPQYWRDLDALLARFPDDLNLRRARLVETTRNSSLVRPIYRPAFVPGNPAPQPNAAELQKTAELKKSELWQNETQRAALVRAARLGQKQAPSDGFFLWMEAMALWNRDDEASLRALERAAKTTDFDDGVMANQRESLRLREQLGPLEWNEKLYFVYAALLPHYSQLRGLAREVTWSGIERYRRGDKAGAYRRWRIALEAGGAFRRSASRGPQSLLIEMLVAQATQAVVWQTVASELNPPPKAVVFPSDTRAANLRAFEQLARRDGQGALADYAVAESAAFEAKKLGDATNMNAMAKKIGTSAPIPVATLQLPWIGRVVLVLSLVGGASLLICLLWHRFASGALWGGASGAQIAFFGALWLGAFGLAAWQSTGAQIQEMSYLPKDNAPLPWLSDALKNGWPFWLAVALSLASSIALCYLQEARNDRRLRDQTWPRGRSERRASIGNLVVGGAWAAVLASAGLWIAMARSQNSFLGAVWIAFTLLAVALTIVAVERGNAVVKTRARLFVVALVCALLSFGLSVWFGFARSDIPTYLMLLGLFIAASALIYLGATSTAWRPFFARALTTGLQTLGGVAALCAVALLLSSLAALPIRARQNRVVNDYIARGEIDWMRSQPEIRKVSKPVRQN